MRNILVDLTFSFLNPGRNDQTFDTKQNNKKIK